MRNTNVTKVQLQSTSTLLLHIDADNAYIRTKTWACYSPCSRKWADDETIRIERQHIALLTL